MDYLERRSLSRAVLLVYWCVSLAVVYGWAFGQESCLNWPLSQRLARTCMHAPVLSLAGPEHLWNRDVTPLSVLPWYLGLF